MRHLLVTCDISWAEDEDLLEKTVKKHFGKVTFCPLQKTIENFDQSDVTDWIVDPAPPYKITNKFIKEKMPNLQNIASPSTGTTHLEEELINNNVVNVYCLRDVPDEKLNKVTSSSESTFFLFLALLRRAKNLFSTDLACWRDELDKFRGRQAAGMRALVFGYGRIGSNVTRYLESFGLDVSVYEPDKEKHVDKVCFLPYSKIAEEISAVDAIFLCFHWSKCNHLFFGEIFLDAMKDNSYLINTSRGENLDEDHLAKLLKDGKFNGVALDVLSSEQHAGFRNGGELIEMEKKLERLIITPHVAGASYDSERMAFEYMLDKLSEVSGG